VVRNSNDITINDTQVFTPGDHTLTKIMFYDQEPLLESITDRYLDVFNFPAGVTPEEILDMMQTNTMPYGYPILPANVIEYLQQDLSRLYKNKIIATSEKSALFDYYAVKYNAKQLYYFFHGFAALDWYRGFYSLNYSKQVVKEYKHDFISHNRIINNDRSYRIYFVSKLVEARLLEHGKVSFNVTDNINDDWRDEVVDPKTKLNEQARRHAEKHLTNISKLVIDQPNLPGSASADIPRGTDALWNIVSETVFYYDKLHLTEKIFKPIVSKQPFMLLAAPGNLAYLRSYGFKTFEDIIDESYDLIQDPNQRTEAVVEQIAWYCALSAEEKKAVIEAIAPIVEYNFHHFYGEFKHIITRELLDNTQTLFNELGYNNNIDYASIYHVLTN
jgi:hypothetical protein